MNIFLKLFAYLRYRTAVNRADKAHTQNGGRYYVIPIVDSKGKVLIVDRSNFRTLKFKHYIPHFPKVSHLAAGCFYCTPYANGSGALSPEEISRRRQAFYNWFFSTRRYGRVRHRRRW